MSKMSQKLLWMGLWMGFWKQKFDLYQGQIKIISKCWKYFNGGNVCKQCLQKIKKYLKKLKILKKKLKTVKKRLKTLKIFKKIKNIWKSWKY